jgi:SAM-dependent methyltransferase
VYSEFPVELLRLVGCPEDGGALTALVTNGAIAEGAVRCSACKREFPISEGILRLLCSLDDVSKQEVAARDQSAATYDDHLANRTEAEITATLDGLDLNGKTVADMGCGTGRITRTFLEKAKAVIAVDFSIESLRILAKKVSPNGNLGLVLANAADKVLRPEQFSAAISTQVLEHLPTSEARARFLEQVSGALKEGGEFVITVYHYSLLHRLKRERQDGVHPSGIYFHRFVRKELKQVMERWFEVEEVRPIQAPAFFAAKIGLPVTDVSRFMERVPLANLTGHLLKARARRR